MTRLPAICVLFVTACTAAPAEIYPDDLDGKADGLAKKLTLVDDHRTDIDEPSDLAFAGGKLFAVSDRHSKIYELDDDGDVQDVIDVEGNDLEALAIDDEGRFYIASEGRGKVWCLSADGERDFYYELDDTGTGNSGIEGLAFDDAGHLLVANEKDPAQIIELAASDGEEMRRETLDFADDLSALAFNDDDGLVYALSDTEHKLFRLDGDFRKITSWKLPIAHPEGLAFDGSTVYVASDSEERLYVFELE